MAATTAVADTGLDASRLAAVGTTRCSDFFCPTVLMEFSGAAFEANTARAALLEVVDVFSDTSFAVIEIGRVSPPGFLGPVVVLEFGGDFRVDAFGAVIVVVDVCLDAVSVVVADLDGGGIDTCCCGVDWMGTGFCAIFARADDDDDFAPDVSRSPDSRLEDRLAVVATVWELEFVAEDSLDSAETFSSFSVGSFLLFFISYLAKALSFNFADKSDSFKASRLDALF